MLRLDKILTTSFNYSLISFLFCWVSLFVLKEDMILLPPIIVFLLIKSSCSLIWTKLFYASLVGDTDISLCVSLDWLFSFFPKVNKFRFFFDVGTFDTVPTSFCKNSSTESFYILVKVRNESLLLLAYLMFWGLDFVN